MSNVKECSDVLVAQTKEGKLISLGKHHSAERLREMRSTIPFFCPSCKESLQLKVGTKKIPHFAHLKQRSCESSHEGETDYHMLGKRRLYEWISSTHTVELEEYMADIRQRPDLLLRTPSAVYPIEYQCASLSLAIFTKRNESYVEHDYRPIWIIGAKRLKRLSTHMIQLKSQDWQYLSAIPQCPTLFYFSPDDQQLIKVSHLYAFSSTICFGTLHHSSTRQLTFEDWVLGEIEREPAIWTAWLERKRKWRTTYMIYSNKQTRPFLELLYALQIPPSHFPAEAGIPLSSSYLFETPSCIWQAYILFDLFRYTRMEEAIAYETIRSRLKKRFKEGHIKQRFEREGDWEIPLQEYLQFLCDIELIKKSSETCYTLKRTYTIPYKMNDVFQADWDCLYAWLSKRNDM